MFFALVFLIGARAEAETPGETRFFAGCPRRDRLHLHDERHPWDLHALLYTPLSLAELEVLQTADWAVDLLLPGAPLRPIERSVHAARAGYNRLPPWRLRRRVGEFVDALQLAELSVGDAAATYSAAGGEPTGPGSGLLVRVDKLIDWAQHVTGDVNQLSGALVGRPRGLVAWPGLERAVDGTQRWLIKTLNTAVVFTTRALDDGLTTIEWAGGSVVNLGHRPPHRRQAVFLRLPQPAYRAHELWILEHRSQLVLGTAEEFARSTHAALAHRRRPATLAGLSRAERLAGEPEVIVMTTVRVIARAPASLASYVVPAAWVLDGAAVPLTNAGAASKLTEVTEDPDPDALHLSH